MIRRRIATFLAIIAAPLSLAAADADPRRVNLEEAMTIALAEQPSMTIASANERIAGIRLQEARSAWLPVLEASEAYSRGNNPVFVFGSLLEQGRFGAANFDPAFLNNPPSLTNYRSALSLRYPLFDQFQRIERTAAAKSGVARAAAESSGTAQSVRLGVLRVFYGALLAAEEERVAEQAVTSAEADVKRIRDRVDTGLLVQSDLLAAEVQSATFRQRAVAAQGEAAIARRALANALGRPHEAFAPDGALVARDLPLPDLSTLVASGVDARSDVRAARLDETIAATQQRAAAGRLLPRLDAFANWGASGGSFSQRNSDHTLGVVATWRIADPTVWQERRRAAEEVKIAEARRTETANGAELAIATAWEHTRAASAREQIASQSIAQADEVLRIVRDRYEQGLTSITEVLRAQTALMEARLLALDAIYDHSISYAELLASSGRLDSLDMFTRPAVRSTGEAQ
ncbi:MAG TPA: TolC family protein [Thermoanaerobaculia bacterium]|nr:TolC family protein [Thermoanaerobaculia bacterium]